MPMTKKDQSLLRKLTAEYHSEKKAKGVFFGGAQKGTFGKDIQRRHGAQARKGR